MTKDAHGSRSAEAGCIAITLILFGIVIGLSLSAGFVWYWLPGCK